MCADFAAINCDASGPLIRPRCVCAIDISMMGEKVRKQFELAGNPFEMSHITPLKVRRVKRVGSAIRLNCAAACDGCQTMEFFEDVGPSVVLAVPGMLHSGISRCGPNNVETVALANACAS